MSAAQDLLDQLDWGDLAPAQPSLDDDAILHATSYLTSWDGTKLFWQSWEAKDGADRKGRIMLMHGYGEHSGRYVHVAAALVRAGYDVMTIDARGHGKSSGKPAHVMLYDEYVLDLERACDLLEERWGEDRGPLFVLGHSNGGLIGLRYALRNPKNIKGFVFTSPFCGFAIKVPYLKAKAGDIMSKIAPSFSMKSDLPPTAVSTNKVVTDAYAKDPLNRDVATARWFTETKQAQKDLLERAAEITHPVFCLSAGDDKLVDPEAAKAVCDALGSDDAFFDTYPKAYHELLNEEIWKDVLARIVVWLNDHLE